MKYYLVLLSLNVFGDFNHATIEGFSSLEDCQRIQTQLVEMEESILTKYKLKEPHLKSPFSYESRCVKNY